LYGSLHGADNQLPSVAIAVATLLHKGKLEGGGLIVHKIHSLLGFRLWRRRKKKGNISISLYTVHY
jgi:hypothetical protein